jgi:hypothetical protein
MTEPRKATDVLLEIETKLNTVLGIVRAQDHVIKIMSNKLNDVMEQLKQQQSARPKFTAETTNTPVLPTVMPPGFPQLPAGDPARNIPIIADAKLPQTDSPQGFRRTSRPETFAGDNAYLSKPGVPDPKTSMPVQMPRMPNPNAPPPGRSAGENMAEVVVPPEATNKKKTTPYRQPAPPPMDEQHPEPTSLQGQIPVMQRVVDRNGKSIFLADVEITDASTSQPVFKTRTNGTGKWMASLGVGAYQVKISKRPAMDKPKLEAIQDIQIDGSSSPFEVPMLIIK